MLRSISREIESKIIPVKVMNIPARVNMIIKRVGAMVMLLPVI